MYFPNSGTEETVAGTDHPGYCSEWRTLLLPTSVESANNTMLSGVRITPQLSSNSHNLTTIGCSRQNYADNVKQPGVILNHQR